MRHWHPELALIIGTSKWGPSLPRIRLWLKGYYWNARKKKFWKTNQNQRGQGPKKQKSNWGFGGVKNPRGKGGVPPWGGGGFAPPVKPPFRAPLLWTVEGTDFFDSGGPFWAGGQVGAPGGDGGSDGELAGGGILAAGGRARRGLPMAAAGRGRWHSWRGEAGSGGGGGGRVEVFIQSPCNTRRIVTFLIPRGAPFWGGPEPTQIWAAADWGRFPKQASGQKARG